MKRDPTFAYASYDPSFVPVTIAKYFHDSSPEANHFQLSRSEVDLLLDQLAAVP